MSNIYKQILMENVLDIIKKRGFYFIRTKVLYPDFIGPKYIIVTDDPDVTVKHPKTKGMIIISPDKFNAMAEEYNRYFCNEDREKHRESKYHIDEGYSEEITEDENGEHQLNPLDMELHPVEDIVETHIRKEELAKALDILSPIQKDRVTLYYFKNWTYEQIGEKYGISHWAVSKSIRTAEKKMKKFLEKGCKSTSPIPL